MTKIVDVTVKFDSDAKKSLILGTYLGCAFQWCDNLYESKRGELSDDEKDTVKDVMTFPLEASIC
jgi:hypothetical protein